MTNDSRRLVQITLFFALPLFTSSLAQASPHGPGAAPAQSGDHESAATITVKRLVFARGVEARKPAGLGDRVEADGGRVYGFVELENKARRQKIAMIWRGEKRSFRYTLEVGKSTTWRTWSTLRAAKWSRGEWSLTIVDLGSDEILAQRNLTIR